VSDEIVDAMRQTMKISQDVVRRVRDGRPVVELLDEMIELLRMARRQASAASGSRSASAASHSIRVASDQRRSRS
jgi:hypothetical protein